MIDLIPRFVNPISSSYPPTSGLHSDNGAYGDSGNCSDSGNYGELVECDSAQSEFGHALMTS